MSEQVCPACGGIGEMTDARYTYRHLYSDIPVKQFRMQCSCGAIWATEYQRERNEAFLRQARKAAEQTQWGG
jgi:hypothetical protein